jgi:hypothetical protein
MRFEIKERSIFIKNETEQDTAYFKDTLKVKGSKSISNEILEDMIVVLHKDTFGNPIYLEVCAKD